MPIKNYLFDFDDTLIDTKIYAQMYIPILNLIKQKLNLTDQELDTKAESLGLVKNKFDRWDSGSLCKELDMIDEYYKVLEEHIQLIPVLKENSRQLLKTLKSQNKVVGIVTNSMARTIKIYLNKYQLNDHIDFVFSIDDTGCKKREESYWKQLIEKKKLNPEECLIIGDDEQQDKLTPEKLEFNCLIIENLDDVDVILNYDN